MATLQELIPAPTVQEVFASLLDVYQANGFPVQSWQPGGVERTRLMQAATSITDLASNYVQGLTAGGLLDYSEQLTNGWLQFLAEDFYSLTLVDATHTVGNITLTAAPGKGPYTFVAGALIAEFAATGNRYINTTGGTLTLGGTLDVEFRAEFPGASYNDPSSSGSISLLSPLPGVTLTNPPETYSAVDHEGSGTGTITLAGSPVSPHQVIIRIDSTGAAGVASWSYSIDGEAYVSAGAVASSNNLGGDDIDVTLVDGVTGASFVKDDTYLFSTPGSWITTQGADTQPNSTLATRCRDRWPTLVPIAIADFYEDLVRATPTVGTQITQVRVLIDENINNKVLLVIAGPEGALDAGDVADVQEYVSLRVPVTDNPVIESPSGTSVTLAGTIVYAGTSQATVEDAVQTAMTNYVNTVGINGTVRLASIIDAVMDVLSVVDVYDVTINAVASNLALGSATTFRVADLQPLEFLYEVQQ